MPRRSSRTHRCSAARTRQPNHSLIASIGVSDVSVEQNAWQYPLRSARRRECPFASSAGPRPRNSRRVPAMPERHRSPPSVYARPNETRTPSATTTDERSRSRHGCRRYSSSQLPWPTGSTGPSSAGSSPAQSASSSCSGRGSAARRSREAFRRGDPAAGSGVSEPAGNRAVPRTTATRHRPTPRSAPGTPQHPGGARPRPAERNRHRRISLPRTPQLDESAAGFAGLDVDSGMDRTHHVVVDLGDEPAGTRLHRLARREPSDRLGRGHQMRVGGAPDLRDRGALSPGTASRMVSPISRTPRVPHGGPADLPRLAEDVRKHRRCPEFTG